MRQDARGAGELVSSEQSPNLAVKVRLDWGSLGFPQPVFWKSLPGGSG